MEGKLLRLGVLTVLLVVVGWGASTLAAAPSSTRTFTVVAKHREFQVVDLSPPGPTHGDLRVFNAPLYNEHETRVIGRVDGVCTATPRMIPASSSRTTSPSVC